MQIEGAFGRIYHTLVGLNVSFSMAIHFQNAHKMRDFQYPLSTGKWDDVPQGETSIAYEVLQILHICTWQIIGAFGRI